MLSPSFADSDDAGGFKVSLQRWVLRAYLCCGSASGVRLASRQTFFRRGRRVIHSQLRLAFPAWGSADLGGCRPNEDGVSRLSVIVAAGGSEAAGWVGYWPRDWRGEAVWEAGWHVLLEFQGRGLATAATRAMLARAAGERTRRYVHAFPSAANAASNAVCAKVGFTSLGETEFEYPPGHAMRCIHWRFDLGAAGTPWTTAGR